MAPKKKDNIPAKVKQQVWDYYSVLLGRDPRIAQCYTCPQFLRYPKSLKLYLQKKYNLNNDFMEELDRLPDEQLKLAAFGHICAEAKGGLTNVCNLVLQCNTCNQRLGTRSIEDYINEVGITDTNMDTLYEDSDTDYMEAESKRCLGITQKGEQCKKCAMKRDIYCHQHYGQHR